MAKHNSNPRRFKGADGVRGLKGVRGLDKSAPAPMTMHPDPRPEHPGFGRNPAPMKITPDPRKKTTGFLGFGKEKR